ncbi:MAG: membrane integrity-associated transporter subunit PqiC [Alphaproteobacteria bacterium]|nr:membrane integrity-associated transporter subunit PqiC [Alphaproteobacteria bacterium]
MKKLILSLIIFLSACIGTSTTPKFYTLNSISASSQNFTTGKIFIGVGEVSVPQYLDKPQMVTRDTNQVELNISEFNRWSEPLGDAIQQAVTDDLAIYLPNATVKPTSYRQENFDYLVWIEINRFDGTWGKNAILSAWWSIYNRNSQIIIHQKTDISASLNKSYDDLAQQYSNLVSKMSFEIASQLAKLKK